MPISSVTSEALQLKIRQLLPSQQGFGTDLSASDTIIPVIDLTASAEGSDTRTDLQTAIAYGSQTAISVQNGTQVIANTVGFWRITATAIASVPTATINMTMTDGASPKTVFLLGQSSGTAGTISEKIDIIVWLAAGQSISATSNGASASMQGSVRQIADSNGTLVQPSGFNPQ